MLTQRSNRIESWPVCAVTYPETIELTAPREAVLSDQAILAFNVLVIRPTSGTAHLTGSLIEPSRFGLPEPRPLSEAELVAGETLSERLLAVIPRVNASDLILKVEDRSPLVLNIEIRNDTWRLSGAPLDMSASTKRALLQGLRSDKDECAGWNALVEQQYEQLIGGIDVLSLYRLRLTLPANMTFALRVPETITLTVPGIALTSAEDIQYQQEGYQDNEFYLLPDELAAEDLAVDKIGDGETVAGELPYFAEKWYTLSPGDASVVLRVDVEFNEEVGRYGALDLQVYEDNSLDVHEYSECGGLATGCGDGLLNIDGTRSCRCVRTDLEHGRAPIYDEPQSKLLIQRDTVVYATPSLGYAATSAGSTCQVPRGRLWISVRCVVDICNDLCRYNMSITRLPHTIDDGDVITTPVESGSWQYFKVPLGNYDVLDLTLQRRSEFGPTPEYRELQPPAPSLPPSPPAVLNATNASLASGRRLKAAKGAAHAGGGSAHHHGLRLRRRLEEGIDEPLSLFEHGLVGMAYARRGACSDAEFHTLSMEVGLGQDEDTAGLFCTDASQTGDMYVGVHAYPSANNVTMPPRHWYTLSVAHEIFDDAHLDSATARVGCLAFGQMRVYKIVTRGALDATLDATVNVPVSAMYARRGEPPTEEEYDAVAPWPLQRLALSGCDVKEPSVWYVAVRLESEATALSREPALGRTRFELTATLKGANASLMRLPVGAQISLPHNHLCCGVYQDFVVEDVTRELALRVEVTVHEGYLEAIYLKHSSCGRYPDDIGEDEACLGRCQMKWLTTYNPYTLVPTYVKSAVVTVPQGVVYADKRFPGDWYISVAGADVVTNFSLVAELVESPIIDRFIPLDEDKAAAERCGRFCVVLADGTTSSLEDGLLPSAAAAGRASATTMRQAVSLTIAGLAVISTAVCSGRVPDRRRR